jgi:parallel beta-helix repeat protein
MNRHLLQVGIAAALTCGISHSAAAATLCVNKTGSGGCFKKISDAVAAASTTAPFDTIRVHEGTYPEDVIIDRTVSLIGADPDETVIDAKGKNNGINVDGLHNLGKVDHVVVRNFTVKNANNEGILITNASDVTIAGNHVTGNNQGLVLLTVTCPTLVPPDSEAGEGFDCGEGIHLSGVDHSTITSNLVEHNAGGILLSDDSGPTHDNLIGGNIVRDNPFDCGITLASHVPASVAATISPNKSYNPPNGVFHNTVSDNESSGNGVAVGGAGAGVGLFTPAPGTATYGNVVLHNRLTDNGLPGVAMHSHAPGQNLNDNAIIGNYIAGNGADTADTATPGPTGINISSSGGTSITGTLVSHNVIEHEAVDIAVLNSTGSVNAHLNDLRGSHSIGVANLGTGPVDAIENWWGCSDGPGAGGCSSVAGTVVVMPWLTHPVHNDADDKHDDKGFGNDRGHDKR